MPASDRFGWPEPRGRVAAGRLRCGTVADEAARDRVNAAHPAWGRGRPIRSMGRPGQQRVEMAGRRTTIALATGARPSLAQLRVTALLATGARPSLAQLRVTALLATGAPP